jgi:hypothetical protein
MVPVLPLSRATWPPRLSRKGIDQPAAEPGIGPSRIGPLPVVGDRQAKLSRHAL